jgi:hypothetical protein
MRSTRDTNSTKKYKELLPTIEFGKMPLQNKFTSPTCTVSQNAIATTPSVYAGLSILFVFSH